ncbi:MAG: ferrous iron transport protein A [Akkermansia sp.]|nr:ferrous iron transport protein A [Akkermansia sp.]MEE1266069.1 ferrous iron transport protein A [Akkermansia sp.]
MNTPALRLNQVRIGTKVRVVRVHGEGALRQRILDMGVTKGAEITVRKMAPFGDPLEVTVRGFQLSLRKAEAASIEVA